MRERRETGHYLPYCERPIYPKSGMTEEITKYISNDNKKSQTGTEYGFSKISNTVYTNLILAIFWN
jgi:hypothetical protein